MWSKLVRLNALACTTSARDKLLGEIRSTPELRAELVGAIEEACAVAPGGGRRSIDASRPLEELSARTPRSAARCSATSPPGARPSWTRSRAPSCARPRVTGCRARRSRRWWRMIRARIGVPRAADRREAPRARLRPARRRASRSAGALLAERPNAAPGRRRGPPEWRSPRRPPAPRTPRAPRRARRRTARGSCPSRRCRRGS